MSQPVVEIEGLHVELGRREILHGISCRLGVSGRGRAIGLLGPNGAGKSTLIRTLLGFHRPTRGSARVLGFDCHRERRQVLERIGYMPETDSFVASMTGVEFLRVLAALSGLPGPVALEKAHETLFHVGLGEARYRTLGTYSLGMRQMARLAQAIVHGPELVILDEPTNGLDPAARRRMLDLIRQMKDEHGMSVIVCSHLLADVEQVCDEVVILKDGAVVHHADLEAERRANRRFVELEVEGDDSGLGAALEQRGAACVREAAGLWRIVLPVDLDVRALWSLAAAQGLSVRRLTQRRDTLEEIFMKAMGLLRRTPGEAAASEEVEIHGDL
ncbi:MAG: ABC transporter ATP-binding protein [Bryobacteraceae bacterium]|nr:MAG: ABC transporter ATP-binding protein [Bryobacteraceae bacterium]